MRRYAEVLRTGPALRLTLVMLPVRLGYAMAAVGLILLAADRTGSYSTGGLALGLFSLAAGALAPLRGSLVDRWGQTRPLLVYIPVFSCAFAAMILANSTVVILVLAVVSGASSPPLLASSRPLWRLVVKEDLVRTGFAIDALSMQASLVLGPALAGVLVVAVSPSAAILTVSVLVLVGGLAFVAMPVSRSWTGSRQRAGLRGMVAAPGVRTLLVVAACVGTAIGAFTVALPAMALDREVPGGAGALLSILAVGSLIGGLWAGGAHSWGSERLAPWALVLFSAGLAVAAVAPTTSGVALALLVAGFGFGPAGVYFLELVDRAAPAGTLVSTFAALVALEGALVAVGASIAGGWADAGRPALGLTSATIAGGVAAAVYAARRHTLGGPRIAVPAPTAGSPSTP